MNWQIVGIALASLLWIASFDRVCALVGQTRDALHRAECVTFCAAALCLTLQIPPVRQSIGEAFDIPNIGRLLGNLAGIYAAWSFYPCMLDLWSHGAVRRGFLTSSWLMLATGATLIVLFLYAPPVSPWALRDAAAAPFTIYEQSAAYTIVYMAYLGGLVFRMFHLSLRCARRVCHSPLAPRRLCLQLQAQTVGWAAGIAFAIHECLFALLRHWDRPYPVPLPAVVSNGLLALAVIGVTSGQLCAPWYWFERYRACRRLYPLWQLLHVATPTIALPVLFSPPRSALIDALGLNDTSLRLRRRIIEIRDGIVALQPYRDPAIAVVVSERCRRAGIGEQERKAIVEAAVLVAATRAKVEKMPLDRRRSGIEAVQLGEASETEAEATYLQRVAAALVSSPIVAAIGKGEADGGRLVGNDAA